MDPLRFGPLDDARSRWIAEGVVSGDLRLRQLGRGADRRRRDRLRRDLSRTTRSSTCSASGMLPDRSAGARPGQRRRATWPCCSARRTGRDGIGGVQRARLGRLRRRRGRRGQAAERAGRRPVRGEAADRGLPGAARRRPGRRHPGPRRRRADLRHERDRQPRAAWAWTSTSTAVPRARAGHGAVRGHDQRVARSGCWPSSSPTTSTRCSPSARAGTCGPPSSDGDRGTDRVRRRPPAHPRRLGRRGAGRRAGRVAARGRARSTTGRCEPPAGCDELDPHGARTGAAALRPTRAPTCSDLLADTSWVWSQYDHQLFLNTVEGPGGDATVLRLKHPVTGVDTGRALALTTDGNHRWCAVDPRRGTALTVAESVLNLACVGARPLAVVNCLNFGNPEHPEVMWQLSEAIDGMAEACRALGIPVVGGNVSLYNESRGADIDPTPGHRDARPGRPARAPAAGSRAGRGRPARAGRASPSPSSSGSAVGPGPGPARWAPPGARPRLPHGGGRRGADAGRSGGLLDGRPRRRRPAASGVALAEMAVRSGVGFQVARIADHAELFSESPSRVVLCVDPERLTTVLNVLDARRRADRPHRRGRRRPPLGQGPGRRGPRPTPCEAWRDRDCPTPLGAGTVAGADRAARAGRRAPARRGRRWSALGRPEPHTGTGARAPAPDDDTPKEACGVFGVYAPSQPVAHLTYLGLYALQHRGQESAGMAVSDGADHHRRQGHGPRVQRVRRPHAGRPHRPPRHRPHPLLDHRLEQLAQRPARATATSAPTPSPSATTATSSTPRSWPPRSACCPAPSPATATWWPSCIARELGTHPESSSDGRALERALLEVLPTLEGAFSFVLMDEGHVIGVRDPARLPAAVPRQARQRLGAGVGEPGARRASAPTSSARSSPAR